MRVRLQVDLTKYHPSLTVGAEGDMIGPFGRRSKDTPKAWVTVRFEQHTLDVLRSQLEIIKPSEPKQGPILPIYCERPPKLGDVVEFSGLTFKVVGLQDQVSENLWLLKLRAE